MPGIGISKTPNRLRPIANTMQDITTWNSVSWKKLPQPNCLIAPNFAATAKLASTRKTVSTPSEYIKFNNRIRPRLCPDCCTKLSTLIAITGNTHGITLRIKPPRNA
jgi:hypothetical protein